MAIRHLSRNRANVVATPQSSPIKGTVKNNAGGYAFPLPLWEQFKRFLILGTEGGTYYVSESKLTEKNAQVVQAAFADSPEKAVSMIIAVSKGGLAPKNDPAIFATAIGVTMGGEARKYALAALPAVCRIGTHLFHFAEFIRRAETGMGRSVQRALQDWYIKRNPAFLRTQLIKYQQRDGWSHKDVLRLARPTPPDALRDALFCWASKGDEAYAAKIAKAPAGLVSNATIPLLERPIDTKDESVLDTLDAFIFLKSCKDVKQAVALIRRYDLPRECVPTAMLKEPEVWEALLPTMGLTAMIRNLGNMTKSGFLTPNSEAAKTVTGFVTSEGHLRDARVHPYAILLALTTYGQGRGYRGKGEWTPVKRVLDALDSAFYLAFQNVQATGKRIYLGLDVSGSMDSQFGDSPLSVREASVAMAMVTARTEEQYEMAAFGTSMVPFDISARASLKSACDYTAKLPWQGTDCSLPMIDALKRKIAADTFVIYTDNETWAGAIHPIQALKKYRKETGINARLVVVGMTATEFSIADPADPGTLDVVGFDASAPAVIAQFTRGE